MCLGPTAEHPSWAPPAPWRLGHVGTHPTVRGRAPKGVAAPSADGARRLLDRRRASPSREAAATRAGAHLGDASIVLKPCTYVKSTATILYRPLMQMHQGRSLRRRGGSPG